MKTLISCLTVTLFILYSCTKDEVDLPKEKTRWENISGNYNVYDSLGNFLYKLNISHFIDDSSKVDGLSYSNLNNQFYLNTLQYYWSNSIGSPEYLIWIGAENSIFDKQNNRWDLFPFGNGSNDGYNVWKNDTILMKYRITNIKYWIEDATPYLDTVIKQIAVKQH